MRWLDPSELERLAQDPARQMRPRPIEKIDFAKPFVPEVLLSGDHAAIAAWRRQKSRERTASRRPDLLVEPEP